VFFAQLCPSSAIEQRGTTEQKIQLRVQVSTPPKLRAQILKTLLLGYPHSCNPKFLP
jgi:hypothetical protein